MASFPVRFTGLNKGMVAFGITRTNSVVEVDDDTIEVRMGWAFRVRAPRADVTSVALDTSRVTGWGAHGWRGVYLINGSSSGIVRIDLASPATGRLLGVRVTVRAVRVSVDDPDGLIGALAGA